MRRVLMAAVLVLPALGAPSRARSQPTLEPPPAVKAARARQEAVKTLEVTYKLTEVVSRGGVSDLLPGLEKIFKLKGPVPEKKTKLESTNRLVFDGEKVRHENNHPTFVMPEGYARVRPEVSAFNGSLMHAYFPDGLGGGKAGKQGFLGGSPLPHAKLYELMPLILTFRGFNSASAGILANDLKPSGVTLPIDGSRCEEYVSKSAEDGGSSRWSYWLDPAKDYVIRRMSKVRQRQVLDQIDITYRRHEVCGWVPASWTRNRYHPGGAVLSAMRAEVVDLQVNQPQPDDTFEIRFPPGTEVLDRRKSKSYRVQADGTMRELTPKGEELPGAVFQPGDSWFRRNMWLVVSLLVAVLIWVAAYFCRRNRSRNT